MSKLDISWHGPRLGPVNVSLTQDLEEFVRRKVAAGLYSSASEVVREALRLLAEQDARRQLRDEEFRRIVAEGLRSAEQEPLHDGEAVFAEIEARLRRLEDERRGG